MHTDIRGNQRVPGVLTQELSAGTRQLLCKPKTSQIKGFFKKERRPTALAKGSDGSDVGYKREGSRLMGGFGFEKSMNIRASW